MLSRSLCRCYFFAWSSYTLTDMRDRRRRKNNGNENKKKRKKRKKKETHVFCYNYVWHCLVFFYFSLPFALNNLKTTHRNHLYTKDIIHSHTSTYTYIQSRKKFEHTLFLQMISLKYLKHFTRTERDIESERVRK